MPVEARYTALADEALATGRAVFDSDIVAVPDVALAEMFANGLGGAPPALVALRANSRVVHFFRLPAGWSA